ncbi:MAG: HAD family hydrolase [Oscillochloris sp.]|nr:HAD family hydrolase [Oscillochloris sp.]
MPTPALLLDRDGTLVEPRHYPRRPEELVLYPNLSAGLRRFQAAGWKLALITNQAGIAHGYFSEADLAAMHQHLTAQLAQQDIQLSGVFYCPHHPEGIVERFAHVCNCRKPQPGMLINAAEQLRIDLDHSWFIGDILDDIEAGNRAGCRTVLVDLGTEARPQDPIRRPTAVARNTAHALAIVAALSDLGPAVELDYQPALWQ